MGGEGVVVKWGERGLWLGGRGVVVRWEGGCG